MKTKVSKLNIILLAIMVLLIFVAVFNSFGQTNSWFTASDTINISVSVSEIEVKVKQGDRFVENEGFVYLGTQTIESNKTYDIEDVIICNNESVDGYYIRCQLFAKIGNRLYNINNCVANELYKSDDGWMYYMGDSQSKDSKQLETKSDQDDAKGVVPIIESLTLPELLKDDIDDSKDEYFSNYQGKAFTLHLFIEGSAIKYNID